MATLRLQAQVAIWSTATGTEIPGPAFRDVSGFNIYCNDNPPQQQVAATNG